MGRNLEKDAIEMAAKNRRILENGFRIFAENTIEKVTMNDVAKAAGIAISSLYRYYSTKPKLVIGVGTWVWEKYEKENADMEEANKKTGRNGAEMFDFYLESFIDLFENHKDLLRFNQFFNAYVQSENISEEEKKPYIDMVGSMEARFSKVYNKGKEDGTLRTDVPEKKMFSATLHLMLAVVTRYAVGLVYSDGADEEEELRLMKKMLVKQYTVTVE